MRYKFGGLIFGGAYFRNFTVFLFPSFSFFFLGGGGGDVKSSRSGLKSECADIFHQSFLWLLRHTEDPQKGRNSCVWLQSRSVLSSFGVVLMSWRVNFHLVRSALQCSACRI